MNLQTYQKPADFLTAMPADLRERFKRAHPRQLNPNETYTFESFINKSFTWSDTLEGHTFWSEVHSLSNFDIYEEIKFRFCRLPIREHLDQLRAEAQAIIKTGVSNLPITKICDYKDFTRIAEEVHSYRKFSNNFWIKLRRAKDYENASNIIIDQAEIVTTYSGDTAPRYELVQLDSNIYGDEAYEKISNTQDTRSGRYLKTDIVTYYDEDADKKIGHKSIIENKLTINGVIFPQYILCSNGKHIDYRIAYRFGAGIHYKTGEVLQIDLSTHSAVYINRKKFFATNKEIALDRSLVYVNFDSYQYKLYMNKNNDDVYLDIVTNEYWYANATPYREYLFCNKSGEQLKAVKISRQIQVRPDFTYMGQIFNPVTTNVYGASATKTFYSRQSAENYGLILETCPHCGELHSQYHDREECEHRNFTNDRYGYHSQKPRYINSRSEFKIGVEIEKESFKGARHSHRDIFRSFGWVKESDSSLDGRIGYELVSPAFGLFGNNLIKEAEKLEARFPHLINGEASSACGGHIHFSRANTSGADTLEMYCGYLPLLYAIYKTRTKRDYCKSVEKETMKYSRDKYQAVRVLDNRIEFRIFPAVKNVTTLKWRVELLRYMAKNPTASPVQVVNDLCDKRTKLHKLFLEIFTEKTIYARAIDTLNMAQKYDRNFYNIDFAEQRKAIAKKAEKTKA